MRLLKLEDGGEFSLTEFVGENIPSYAILSHTWGAEHEEVTFKDLVEGTGKTKAGYEKIRFCGKQAANDDLQYFFTRSAVALPPFTGELEQVRLLGGKGAFLQLEDRFRPAALLLWPFREMRRPAVLGGGIVPPGL